MKPYPAKKSISNSEKYELKARDWNRPGNIKPYISELNRVRRSNGALQQTSDLTFLNIEDQNVIGFVKSSADRSNVVAVAIALSSDQHYFWLPLDGVQVLEGGELRPIIAVENLITHEVHPLEWNGLRLTIDPMRDPAVMFKCLG